jgi:hypothetical protein
MDQRHAGIEPAQLQRIVNLHLVEDLVLGIVFHDDADRAGSRLHMLGQAGDTGLGEGENVLRRRSGLVQQAHVSCTAVPETATIIIEPDWPMTV